jgi:hypothetical protein
LEERGELKERGRELIWGDGSVREGVRNANVLVREGNGAYGVDRRLSRGKGVS